MRWMFKKGMPIITEPLITHVSNHKSCQTFQNIDAQTTHSLGLDAEGFDWDRIAEKVTLDPYLAMGYSMLIGVGYLYDNTYSEGMRDTMAWRTTS